MHKIGGAHVQCMENHYAKFEYKGMKTVGVTDYTNLPLNHSRRVVLSYKQKYVHGVLVNCLFKLAQEKEWLGELKVPT